MEKTVNLTNTPVEEIQPESKKRLDFIDIAKGILILAVVIAHSWFAKGNILADFFPYSMPAFFFISGYTYKPGKSYLRNMGKRVVQLIVPYAAFGVICNLLYPLYLTLSKTWEMPGAREALWNAFLKADALNMLMSTPMWFLAALFTASIIFFAIANHTRDSLPKTVVVTVILVAAALVIDIFKKSTWPWFLDLAPYSAAMMILGAYLGNRKIYAKLSARAVVIGLVCIVIAGVFNHFFPGSNKTSVVTYIEPKAWYGVLTAFVIAFSGTIGIICVAKLVEYVPVLRSIFKWLGKNSIWILCIHYCAIMLLELWLYNEGILSNSIMDVVSVQIFGFGFVFDKPQDIWVKLLVALVSILISAVYALIHNFVKGKIKKAMAKKAAA